MDNLKLDEIDIGHLDGRDEFLREEQGISPFEYFLIPKNVSVDRFLSRRSFFLKGFRGTGKTTFLRWFAHQRRTEGHVTQFILFKSDFTEPHRVELSKLSGFDIEEVSAAKFEFSQDFKEAWLWFVFHQIGKIVLDAGESIATPDVADRYLALTGLRQSLFKKVLGYFPALRSGKVKITGELGVLRADLEQSYDAKSNEVPLYSINEALQSLLKQVQFKQKWYIIFDELEVFYHEKEQYRRDILMVRDMIFAIKRLNDYFQSNQMPIYLLAGIRTEILDAIGAQGQEIGRVVHDFGELIAWHQSNASIDHPLIQMIVRKLQASERRRRNSTTEDAFKRYFPAHVGETRIENYLLINSFFKPRDFVWRLLLAQRAATDATVFSQKILEDTFSDYSSKLWEEVTYELSATYSPDDIRIIETLLSGRSSFFYLSEFQERLKQTAEYSEAARRLQSRRSAEEIANDLYRLGVLGNEFRDPAHGRITHRWIFRGDSSLIASRNMVLHRALWKHFATIGRRLRT